jgi:membrane associated rhomboid family serine protease
MIGAIVVAYLKKWMITYALIFANIFVFILTIIYPYELIYGLDSIASQSVGLGFRPIYLSTEYFPQLYTLFTSMFIHGGFAHLLGNMLVFFFIGMAFEQRIGFKKFIIIYILAGICGTLTHSLLNLGSTIPLIGASGAIFGIMGAFAYSYPRDEVVMPIPVGFFLILRRIKVIYAVLIFAALETIIVILDVQDTTAHFAHLGGLVGGVVLASLLIRRKSPSSTDFNYKVSYGTSQPQMRKIDFGKLRKLVKTPEQKEMLAKIESETVPQVRDIWLEHFLEKVDCPKCGKTLNHFGEKIWCDNCSFKTEF